MNNGPLVRPWFEKLIARCGLRIAQRATVGTPVDVLERGGGSPLAGAARVASRLDRLATRLWPTMFGYQFIYRLERG